MCAVVVLLSCLGAFMGNFLALSLFSAQLFCAAACCYAVVASRAAFRIVTFGAEGTADRVASEVMTNALCLCSVKAEREREREGGGAFYSSFPENGSQLSVSMLDRVHVARIAGNCWKNQAPDPSTDNFGYSDTVTGGDWQKCHFIRLSHYSMIFSIIRSFHSFVGAENYHCSQLSLYPLSL